MSPRRGPQLPYSLVAGVTPTGTRWLVVSAKIHGGTFAPEEPRVFDSFREVLDESPAFNILVVNAPIGYLDLPDSGIRGCDREARELLGARGSTVHNAPTRADLDGRVPWSESQLDAVTATLLPNYRQVAAEMFAYRQRSVFQGHPELSFYQLNADNPLRISKKIEEGRDERRDILELRIPGIAKVLDAQIFGVPIKHIYDASALLWTARRVHTRSASRLPSEPEWDGEGLRMEYVM